MRRQTQRMRRVNEAVREVISTAVAARLKDPRLGFITVTAAEVSPDLRHAKVFYSVLGSQRAKELTAEALRAAHGFLQGVVARELRLKRTPELEFQYDHSIDQGMRIHVLIRSEERALGLAEDLGEEETARDETSREQA